jgi:hypothetical protein
MDDDKSQRNPREHVDGEGGEKEAVHLSFRYEWSAIRAVAHAD